MEAKDVIAKLEAQDPRIAQAVGGVEGIQKMAEVTKEISKLMLDRGLNPIQMFVVITTLGSMLVKTAQMVARGVSPSFSKPGDNPKLPTVVSAPGEA